MTQLCSDSNTWLWLLPAKEKGKKDGAAAANAEKPVKAQSADTRFMISVLRNALVPAMLKRRTRILARAPPRETFTQSDGDESQPRLCILCEDSDAEEVDDNDAGHADDDGAGEAEAAVELEAEDEAEPASTQVAEPSALELERILVMMDGEHSQIEAILSYLVPLAEKKNIEILKTPASTSMVLQTNDACKMHQNMKSEVASIWSGESKIGDAHYTSYARELLRVLDASSRETYLRFLSHFPEIASKATLKTIKAGWATTGLHPPDTTRMFQQSGSYKDLTPDQVAAISAALPAITEYAALNGSTPTDLMKSLLGDLGGSASAAGEDHTAGEQQPKRRKVLEEMPINYGRAFWLNHTKVTNDRKAKAQAKIDEEEEKRRATEQKAQERLEKEQQRAENKKSRDEAKEAKRKREEEADTRKGDKSARKEKETRCANPGCNVLYDSEDEDSVDWMGCNQRGKKCKLWFCPKKPCQKLLDKHELVCATN